MMKKKYSYEEVEILCKQALIRLNEERRGDPMWPEDATWEDCEMIGRSFWVRLFILLLDEVLPEE